MHPDLITLIKIGENSLQLMSFSIRVRDFLRLIVISSFTQPTPRHFVLKHAQVKVKGRSCPYA